MFQMEISDLDQNIKHIDYLHTNLAPAVRNAGGILLRESGSDRQFVHIACEEEKSQPVREKLTELLADIICNGYKAAFFHRNLKMETPCMFNFSTLVKTLVAFDREGDRDIVLQTLSDMPERLAIDGLFHFRLGELKDRWSTVVKLTSDNALSLSHKDIFLEFISFMLTTIEGKHKTVNVHKTEGDFTLSEGKNPLGLNKLLISEDDDKEENLIAALIFFAPEKVVLNFEEGLSQKTLGILNVLFDVKTKK